MHQYQKHNTEESTPYTSENDKIAQIYHKMLMGDKSALSNLQKINLSHPSHSKIIKKNQNQILTEREIKPITHQIESQSLQGSPSFNQNKNKNVYSNQKNKNTVQIDTNKQQLNIVPAQKLKQIDKFRKYIKDKVTQLRNQRNSFNKQAAKQVNNKSNQAIVIKKEKYLQNQSKHVKMDIKKVKPHQFNQSKSFDLSNQKLDKIKPTKNMITLETQQKNIRIRKTPKQNNRQNHKNQNNRQNHKNILTQKLPNLKKTHNIKIITQNSTQNDHQKSNYFSDISQNQISIPIKITNNKNAFQTRSNNNNSFQTGSMQKKIKQKKQEIKPSSKKIQRIKISLPQMKRQREQLVFLNQQQKQMQMEIFQYHKQTKSFINSIKEKYNMNFRNQHLMQLSKSRVSSESINLSKINTNSKQLASNRQKSPQNKKELIKAKITENYEQIQALNKSILQNKSKIVNIDNKLDKNSFNRYFQKHQDDQIQQEIQDESQQLQQNVGLNMGETNYSTAMSQIKQKKYPLKKMIQYDTNRSFQQFSQSRNKSGSRFNSVKKQHYIQNLSKIQQSNQVQNQDSSNKVTVNSRLKNLLFS